MNTTAGARPAAWTKLLSRALRRRCPNCGGAGLFEGWLRMRAACGCCGMAVERAEDGYFTGAWMLNIIIAELALVAILLLSIFATWPAVPWDLVTYGGAALMIVVPVAAFPYTRTLWLACDLAFRPAEAEDFTEIRSR